ncbi:MAG: succinate dehydrogenase, hydrophobic membrane anchor protein [Gammaproteobacteria bacterium]
MSDGFFAAKCLQSAAAKEGVFHWLMQRISALVLIPLPFWMIFFLRHLLHSSYERIAAWMVAPLNAVFLVFLMAAAAYHAFLGIQSVLDDYIHHEGIKSVLLWSAKLGFLFMLLVILAAVWLIGTRD